MSWKCVFKSKHLTSLNIVFSGNKPVSPYGGYNGQHRSIYQPTELAIITKGVGNVSAHILLLIWLCIQPPSPCPQTKNKRATNTNVHIIFQCRRSECFCAFVCSPAISIWTVFLAVATGGIVWQYNSTSIRRHSTQRPKRSHQPLNTTRRYEKNIFKCTWGALVMLCLFALGLSSLSPFTFTCLPSFCMHINLLTIEQNFFLFVLIRLTVKCPSAL